MSKQAFHKDNISRFLNQIGRGRVSQVVIGDPEHAELLLNPEALALFFSSFADGQLRAIDLQGAECVNDTILHLLADKFPLLEELSVAASPAVTGEGVSYVAHRCEGIRKLSFYGCEGIEGGAFQLGEGITRHQLTDLCLALSENIQGEAFCNIAQHFPFLQRLNITDCEWVTDTALINIAQSCPAITDLSLAGCGDGVTDPVLECFAAQGNMQVISLEECQEVTDGGVSALIAHCDRLRSVDVDECESISAQKKAELKQQFPAVPGNSEVSQANIQPAIASPSRASRMGVAK